MQSVISVSASHIIGIGFTADVIGFYRAVLAFTAFFGISGLVLVVLLRMKVDGLN